MQGAATGLEGCHATCNGREQRRKLINCPWIINSWSPEAQSLRLDFKMCPSLCRALWRLQPRPRLSSQEESRISHPSRHRNPVTTV